MKRKLSYLRWRERIRSVTPEDHRIGTDLLLIERDAGSPEASFPEGPFKCDMTSAIFYDAGSSSIRINMREFFMEAPCILIIMKDQICEPVASSPDVAVRAVVMSQRFLDGMIQDIGGIHPLRGSVYRNPVIYTDSIRSVFNSYYEMLLNIMKSERLKYKEKAAKHLTLAMFYGYFCNRHLEARPQRRSRQEEIFSRFLDLLHLHHKKERLVTFYAGMLCITPKYLSMIVKDLTGHTALEYIGEYVVTEAKSLLSSTNMDIQQISNELNFPSQSVFGKYFKRVTDMSPKEYRKRTSLF